MCGVHFEGPKDCHKKVAALFSYLKGRINCVMHLRCFGITWFPICYSFFLAISPDFQNQNEGATFSTTKIDVKSASSAEFVSSFLLLKIWKSSSRNKFSD